MIKTKRKIVQYLLPVSLFLTGFSFSQDTDFGALLKSLKSNDQKQINLEFQTIDTSKISLYDKATWLYYYADYQSDLDNHHIAYEAIIEAKKTFSDLKKESDVADCNILLISILSHQNNLEKNYQEIVSELTTYAKKQNDSTALRTIYHRLAVQQLNLNNARESIKYFRKNIEIAIRQKDCVRVGYNYSNIGIVHQTVDPRDLDSALYYTKKAVPILKKYNDHQSLAYNYNNQAQQYKSLKKYELAIQYYRKADSVPLKHNRAKSKKIFYENISDLYQKTKDYKNAAIYLDKLNKLKDSINDTQQNTDIAGIKEKYDNEKLRADNLEIDAKRRQNRNFMIGSLVLLLFGGITAFLINKNAKRKQRIAEQEREIEIQKTEKLLKEQELTAIDAMIVGQEKERQRLANDLHDNLGSTLATVKLHFQHLQNNRNNPKIENIEELYTNTNELLDEAYQKVRTIAHEKNSGVMANQGLLPAIKNLAKKVSNGNNLKIEVQGYGLEERLDNTIEISIFRMVQELVTNIIKHAQANEVHISLTNHDSLLNIIIEDNGEGFDAKILPEKDGMGLATIEKRIEHLEGTFEIDSTPRKGTNIIINIPI
ncbi:sensor histidine kinase [Aquimarina sp. AU474]|uniref:tetratricopeptide repeat-containing sensor histidine kinase n=1 Tax=Aquimarina sp. AU474 TaxID=2108529 RepID=UPI000D69868C|nr:sensor histidine kinase [Aquimarina sp. AU474]